MSAETEDGHFCDEHWVTMPDGAPCAACGAYEAGRKAGDAEGYARAIREVVTYLRDYAEDPNPALTRSAREVLELAAEDIERGEHIAKANNRGPGSLARGDNPDPTPEGAPVKGAATHSQGASPEAANVAKPQHDPASAPASCTRSSSSAKVGKLLTRAEFRAALAKLPDAEGSPWGAIADCDEALRALVGELAEALDDARAQHQYVELLARAREVAE